MDFKKAIKNTLCCALAGVMLFGCTACGSKDDETTTTTTSTTQSTTETTTADLGNMNPLTGEYGLSDDAVGDRPIAVVVENSAAARPQWGLSSPDVLVEGVVEGGITRMLLLYSDVNEIPKVGPIRSARHDFVEFAECFDAIFVHCGWSIYAEKKIKNDGVNNLNGIQNYTPKFFYRDSSRAHKGTEHTGYSNGKYISATVDAVDYRTTVKQGYESVLGFVAYDSAVTPANTCNNISFQYSSSAKYSMKYNQDDGQYYTYLGSNARKDADGVHLNYKNVLVLYCNVNSMGDSKGCVDMKLENANTGYYISNGGYEEISWTKNGSASSSKLVIKKNNGEALTMNPGNTYIALVPTSQKSATSIA
ncbi:MAG: DUF3048 domain-containing protein [Clostridia bacterium]|nr:DUF3048 domain-containing protein [Clostridia bacterium]